MFCLNDTMRYFLCPGNTDMRKGISSLCGVVRERMGRSVKNGDVFIFIGRSRKLMKLIHAEDGGLVMYVKRLEDIIALGCHRILTSGQAATDEEGVQQLKELIKQADGRIIIMPGCGVNSGNAARIIAETGATEIHASARKSIGSGMKFRHSGVSMGNPDCDEYARKETCEEEVRKIVEAIA